MPISLASTSASSMHGAMVPIGYAYASTTTNVFQFNNIPQGYQDLRIIVYGRSDISGVLPSGVSFYTQQTSGTAYFSATGFYANNGAVTATKFTQSTPTYGFQTVAAVLPGSTGLSGTYGLVQADIFNYANTTTYKACISQAGVDQNATTGSIINYNVGLWAQTSAITAITVATYGNFAAGSSAAIYGIRTVGQ